MPSFPSSPSLNQKFTAGGRVWNWNGAVWELVQGPVSHASTHATGGSDPITAASIGAVGAASPTFTGTITAPILLNTWLRQPVYSAGNSGASITIDPTNGTLQHVVLTGTSTVAGQTGSFSEIVFANSAGNTFGMVAVLLESPNSSARATIRASTGVLANPDWVYNLSASSGTTLSGSNLPYTVANPGGTSYSMAVGFPLAGGIWAILIFGPFV